MSVFTALADKRIVPQVPAVAQSARVQAPAATAAADLERALAAIVRGHADARLLGRPDADVTVADWNINNADHCLVVIKTGASGTTLRLPFFYEDRKLASSVALSFPGVSRSTAWEIARRVLGRPLPNPAPARPAITEADLAAALRRFTGHGAERTNDPAECAAVNCGYLRRGVKTWRDGAPYMPWHITPEGAAFLAEFTPAPVATKPFVLTLPWIVPPVALLAAPQVEQPLLLPATCPKPYHPTPARERARFMADFQARVAALAAPRISYDGRGVLTAYDGRTRAFCVETSHNRTVIAAPINMLKAEFPDWSERYQFGPLSQADLERLARPVIVLPREFADLRGEVLRAEYKITTLLAKGPQHLLQVAGDLPQNVFNRALKNLEDKGRIAHLPYGRLQLTLPDASDSRAAFESDLRSELAARSGHRLTINARPGQVDIYDHTAGEFICTCRNGWSGALLVHEYVLPSSAKRPAWTRAYARLAYDAAYLKPAVEALVKSHNETIN